MSILRKNFAKIQYSDIENFSPEELLKDLNHIECFLQQALFWQTIEETKKIKKDCSNFYISAQRPMSLGRTLNALNQGNNEELVKLRHLENSASTGVSYSKNLSNRKADNINKLLFKLADQLCSVVMLENKLDTKELHIDFEKNDIENYLLNQEYLNFNLNDSVNLTNKSRPLVNMTTMKEYKKVKDSGLIHDVEHYYYFTKKQFFLKLLGETFIEIFTKYPEAQIVLNHKNINSEFISANNKEIDNEFAYIFNKFYESPIKNYIFRSIPDKIYVYKNKNICNLFSEESNIEQKKLWEQRQKEYNSVIEKNALLNVLDSVEPNINRPTKRL